MAPDASGDGRGFVGRSRVVSGLAKVLVLGLHGEQVAVGTLLFGVAVGELVKAGAVIGFDEVGEFMHDDRINHPVGKGGDSVGDPDLAGGG